MTDREAMRQALEALTVHGAAYLRHQDEYDETIALLRAQLEQPEPITDEQGRPMTYWGGKAHPKQAEPVAMEQCSFPSCQTTGGCVGACTRSTQPVSPQRKPLTDEQIKTALYLKSCEGYRALVRQIEAAHGIKEGA